VAHCKGCVTFSLDCYIKRTYPLFHDVKLAQHELDIDEDHAGPDGEVKGIPLDSRRGQVVKAEQRKGRLLEMLT
jgi:hypothetical protein